MFRTHRKAAFCKSCNLAKLPLDIPTKRELHASSFEVTKAWTRASTAFLFRNLRMEPIFRSVRLTEETISDTYWLKDSTLSSTTPSNLIVLDIGMIEPVSMVKGGGGGSSTFFTCLFHLIENFTLNRPVFSKLKNSKYFSNYGPERAWKSPFSHPKNG